MDLRTQRLHLRRVTEQDWSSIREIWLDFNASPYARFDRPHSTKEDEVRARIARWAEAGRGTEHLFFAVCLHGQMIGYISCNARTEGYELGYCFHSAYHGQGYARESITAVCGFLKGLGATKLTAGTALENTPSVRLLQALGFQQTGTESVSFYRDASGNDIIFQGGIFELPLV